MTRHLTIEWDPAARPITGALVVGSLTPTSFIGWIELLALLQAALTTLEEEDQ